MGVYSFRENDPVHFGNLAVTMLTLFRCATLEDWSDVMYINMFGCNGYDSGLYSKADSLTAFNTGFGIFNNYDCYAPSVSGLPTVILPSSFPIYL